ncbi:FliI/YscN family ATPase [Gimesia maris]|uniref:ATP synthase YscN n=1 Tax=Gimesia maris TaxID=122 RepID=A0ABX5YKY4_9PLAN|nr:FliI/YscN family ATPase [Gimesia maris]EDL56804.1 flagellum-specific ATP synthase [Gimesia maris DSM 8797]QEG16265.1 putative ATP synthase YscN [Gimesia maris]QGQ30527.1 FliI/YscN family ATPase [Gimesia maris]
MFDVSQQIKQILPFRLTGRVTRVVGLTASVSGFPAPLGSVCAIDRENGSAVEAEVVGFQNEETLLLPYEDLAGIRRGDRVSLIQSVPAVAVGQGILGRVLDGRGRCIDGKNQAMLSHRANLKAKPISPLNRPRIDSPLSTGIRTIDGLLTCGKGQRLGIFAGSGVGKSTLMGQMARQSSADINVVCLVGERGREVREFLDRDLGSEGLERSVVIVATSDEPALIRLRAAHLATAVSEFFRDCGKDVLLMMDSVTRYALAQREIGLAAGEPPATRGYPPSVFSLLPKLLERSGRTESGSITGFYTVLVEADDANEPISDTVRGILDGHIMLSRKLAHESHWPAIDVLQSISRSMNDITSAEHQQSVAQIKKLMAAYQQSEDLISIGAYQAGSNPEVDLAIKMRPLWNEYLKQGNTEDSDFHTASEGLTNLVARMQQLKPMKASEAGQIAATDQTAQTTG